MSTNSNFIIVGRFGKTHGVQGYLKIQSFTEPLDNIFNYLPWHIKQNEMMQTIEIASKQKHHDKFVVKILGFDTPEQAQSLTNKSIYVLQDQLPTLAKNEFYWVDLIGLTVLNQNGVMFGTVKEIISTGANDVVMVEGEKQHLIPFIPETYILSIDLEKNTMTVHWEMDFS
ncbi:MAG: ribosome maturation factor RimM [Gammaproteobacteria bacterium]